MKRLFCIIFVIIICFTIPLASADTEYIGYNQYLRSAEALYGVEFDVEGVVTSFVAGLNEIDSNAAGIIMQVDSNKTHRFYLYSSMFNQFEWFQFEGCILGVDPYYYSDIIDLFYRKYKPAVPVSYILKNDYIIAKAIGNGFVDDGTPFMYFTMICIVDY